MKKYAKRTPKIDWKLYNKSDWVRVPGSARRYKNITTGKTISRVAWLRHYGNISTLGFSHPTQRAKYEKKQNPKLQLARPARHRTSLLGKNKPLTPELFNEIIDARISEISERIIQKKIHKLIARGEVLRYPHQINASTFPSRKHMGRTIALPIAREPAETVRKSAAKWGNVFGYFIGLNFIDNRDGSEGAYAFFPLRLISQEFTIEDFEDAMAEAINKGYVIPTSLFIYLAVKKVWLRKYRGFN